MTSINGFCNEEFELEMEFCQKKMHGFVIKVYDMDTTHHWKHPENSFWNFLAESIMAYKYNHCS